MEFYYPNPGVNRQVDSCETGNFRGVTGTKKDQPDFCHIIPGTDTQLKQQDIFLLPVPRPTLRIMGEKKPVSNNPFSAILQAGWDALGRPANLKPHTEPGSHEYCVAPAITFFKSKL